MEAYADSLRLQNRLLNHKLYDFVSSLDNQIQQSFTEQYLEITETRWKSFRLFAIVISIVIVLFIISFFPVFGKPSLHSYEYYRAGHGYHEKRSELFFFAFQANPRFPERFVVV